MFLRDALRIFWHHCKKLHPRRERIIPLKNHFQTILPRYVIAYPPSNIKDNSKIMINNITLYERRNKKETNISTAKQINKTFYTRVTHIYTHYFSQNFPLRQMSKQLQLRFQDSKWKKSEKIRRSGWKKWPSTTNEAQLIPIRSQWLGSLTD